MNTLHLVRYGRAAATFGLLLAWSATLSASDSTSGREMFDREWTRKDKLSGGGDGLGPMFNARSCAACHHQQGSGGGGTNEHNVDLLTVVNFTSQPKGNPPARTALERLHPGFRTTNSITLHTNSNNGAYKNYRLTLLGQGQPKIRSVSITRSDDYNEKPGHTVEWDAFVLKLSHRNTPALYGAGLIDRISDEAIRKLAERPVDESTDAKDEQKNKANSDPFLGRAFVRSTPARFGWKGQTATLKAFVAGACANELGLQTKGIAQSVDPTQPMYHHDRVDMTTAQLDALVSYVASLPPPRRLEPTSKRHAESLTRGALLFSQAKCQSCHVPDVENVRGLYSDLQLHNMGQPLSDPTGPALAVSTPRGAGGSPFATSSAAVNKGDDLEVVGDSSSSEPYYGPSVEQLAPLWRTPPLWGVRDSAPYLHDGRATTLDEAISLHAGEAASSAAHFRSLTKEERRDLVAFVHSLGAP